MTRPTMRPLEIFRLAFMVLLVPLAVIAWLVIVPIADLVSAGVSRLAATFGRRPPDGTLVRVRLEDAELVGLSDGADSTPSSPVRRAS